MDTPELYNFAYTEILGQQEVRHRALLGFSWADA